MLLKFHPLSTESQISDNRRRNEFFLFSMKLRTGKENFEKFSRKIPDHRQFLDKYICDKFASS